MQLISNSSARTVALAMTMMLVLVIAISAFASTADAAKVNVYKDGPVVFLNKSETYDIGTGASAFGAGMIGLGIGNPTVALSASIAVGKIADRYITNQINRGRCIEVKWRPYMQPASRQYRIKWYSYAPWCY